jgi:arylsulfatase A
MPRVLALAGAIVTLSFLLPACSGKPRPPNLIIVFADDLGYTDVGCYWDINRPNRRTAFLEKQDYVPRIETPNIDRMASEGVLFTQFLVGASMCSASRAALLTACYPPRVGFSVTDHKHNGVVGPQSRTGLNPSELTLAELLKSRGYKTACIGKWHLGHHDMFLPRNHGFDYDYGPTYIYPGEPAVLWRNGRPADTLAVDYLTQRYTSEAVEFIKSNRRRPFFLYLSHNMPHIPLGVTEAFAGKSTRGRYGDVVMELDWSVGQILKAVTDAGIDDRTLIVFLSDNGPWLSIEERGGSSLPLRGGKGWPFQEGGFRVPCIMRWPGRIPPHETDALAAAIDIMPTFGAIIGSGPPYDNPIDGVDIQSLLFGEDAPPPRELFHFYKGDSLCAVRKGRWKLSFRDRRGEVVPAKLFDLITDPSELTDLSSAEPDIVAELEAEAERMRPILGDRLSHTEGRERRPAGVAPAE